MVNCKDCGQKTCAVYGQDRPLTICTEFVKKKSCNNCGNTVCTVPMVGRGYPCYQYKEKEVANCKDCGNFTCHKQGKDIGIGYCAGYKQKQKREFDWTGIDKKWKYVATDLSGATRLFTAKPRIEGWNFWVNTDEYEIVNPCHNWKDTLIERPRESAMQRTFRRKLTQEQTIKVLDILDKMEAENYE